ncbi:hypothetical protein CHS0354_041717 [Potamilus streckersoni]|uniref:Uncharacterized protein n=1 Tax=Potamilus streckersoni TaxID=2493646 RepID=A0AAE0W521_9BIVA|nr:hypothetical protein CHS0354_041717 [Potamilus streckersoni]
MMIKAKEAHMYVTFHIERFILILDLSTLPEIAECCDAHDKCYDTCNKDKLDCDKTFKKSLEKKCKDLKYFLNDDQSQACHATAMVIYPEVYAVGCERYQDSQTKRVNAIYHGKRTNFEKC